MTIPTSESLINAAADTDLALRFVALGATLGYTQGDIESNLRKLVAAQLNANGDTVASVYDYAYQVRKQALDAVPPSPGANLAAVTDDYIRSALNKVFGSDGAHPLG